MQQHGLLVINSMQIAIRPFMFFVCNSPVHRADPDSPSVITFILLFHVTVCHWVKRCFILFPSKLREMSLWILTQMLFE